MSNSTYFVQECPTCGRRLHVRVEYLGRRLVCQHCRGSLVATDSSSRRDGESASPSSMIHRADELLEHYCDQAMQGQRPQSF